MTDEGKTDSFKNRIFDRAGQIRIDADSFKWHPNERTYAIPIIDLKIFHQDKAMIGFDGAVFINNQYCFDNARRKEEFEKSFLYVQQLSFLKIRSLRDIKNYLKKFFFTKILFLRSIKNRKKMADKNKVKLVFCETAYHCFYHFFYQYYPTLHYLLEYCEQLGLDYYVVMPPKCNRGLMKFYDYIDEIMDIEQIPEEKKVYLDYQNYEAQNVLYTNFPQENPDMYKYMLQKFRKKIERKNKTQIGSRIYISRKKSARRKLVNENEIFKLLEQKYGFVSICMEDFSVREKFEIMSNAEVVISIDGTSLLNAYLSNKQVKAIGLRHESFSEQSAIISALFDNVEYLPIVVSLANVKDKGGFYGVWSYSDLYVDPQYLEEKLREYGVHQR